MIKASPSLLENRSTVKDFMPMLELAYDFRQQKQIPLAFLADQAARSRMFKKDGRQEMEVQP